MKPRSKRNRKKPRGGIGCLVGDGENDGNNDAEGCTNDSPASLLRVEVVPFSKAFDIISNVTRCSSSNCKQQQANDCIAKHSSRFNGINLHQRQMHAQRRVRIIHPYPFTFATFAKARWVGRTVVDVYHGEFGSYPRSYYEAGIKAGRILVSGKRVDCNYTIKGGDELTHTVHRHEPAVGLADISFNSSAEQSKNEIPPVQIVHEDDKIMVVDKPSTLPIHPCGGYNFNSLFEILSQWRPDSYGSGNLFTVHRLDRLTSGLVLVAKSSAMARSLSKCIMDRDGCEKIYLARVKGKFPLNLQQQKGESPDNLHQWEFRYNTCTSKSENGDNGPETKRQKCSNIISPLCQYGEIDECNSKAWAGGLQVPFINSDKKGRSNKTGGKDGNGGKAGQLIAGLGYWMTDGNGNIAEKITLQDLADQCEDASMEEMLTRAIGPAPDVSNANAETKQSALWLNFACPCRIASHKSGVCEAGSFVDLTEENDRKGIKPAQTSFTLLSYDALSDTSLVVARPVTGRTHQIRLHLQTLGHPIANDHCYGGEIWFGDEEGKGICNTSREWIDRLDKGELTKSSEGNTGSDGKTRVAPENSTNADTPASDAEIYQAAANRPREEGESILDFIEKTCVWCARCRGVDDLAASSTSIADRRAENEKAVFQRTLMEYLVRSQGIWLHALQYSLKITDDLDQNKTMGYRTNLPSWASMM